MKFPYLEYVPSLIHTKKVRCWKAEISWLISILVEKMADGVPPPSSNEKYTENLSLDSTQDAQELTASLESGCTSSLSTNQSFPTSNIITFSHLQPLAQNHFHKEFSF